MKDTLDFSSIEIEELQIGDLIGPVEAQEGEALTKVMSASCTTCTCTCSCILPAVQQ